MGAKTMTFAPAIFMRKCTGPREAQACFSRPRQGREGSGDVPQTTKEAALAADAPPISANEKRDREVPQSAKRVERSSRGLGMCPSRQRRPLSGRLSTRKAGNCQLFLWRWAESNRRPNKAPSGFLHAYPAFGCRGPAAGRRAIGLLASES